eukprot:g48792.t1
MSREPPSAEINPIFIARPIAICQANNTLVWEPFPNLAKLGLLKWWLFHRSQLNFDVLAVSSRPAHRVQLAICYLLIVICDD